MGYRLVDITRFGASIRSSACLSENESVVKIDDNMRKCVVFIYTRVGKDVPRGTAFLVNLGGTPYLVTAKHVLDKIAEKFSPETPIWLRVNTLDGKSEMFKTSRLQWKWVESDTEYIDVAVLPIGNFVLPSGVDPDILGWMLFDIDSTMGLSFVTEELLRGWGEGIGEDLFFPGLFVHHPGTGHMVPIVRIGNIAAMPDESIQMEPGPIRGYLIEARSIGGLSGSPVFLHRGNPRLLTAAPQMYLLGLLHGHVNLKNQEDIVLVVDGIQQEVVNMGLALVVPVERILEALNMPELKDPRDAREVEDAPTEAIADIAEDPETSVGNTADMMRKLLQVPKEEADEVHRGHDQP